MATTPGNERLGTAKAGIWTVASAWAESRLAAWSHREGPAPTGALAEPGRGFPNVSTLLHGTGLSYDHNRHHGGGTRAIGVNWA